MPTVKATFTKDCLIQAKREKPLLIPELEGGLGHCLGQIILNPSKDAAEHTREPQIEKIRQKIRLSSRHSRYK